MELNEAIRLIRNGVDGKPGIQRWADLGSGEGLFTKALASLLSDGSEVFAVDSDARALSKTPPSVNGTALYKMTADFINVDLALPALNGILMANSLHFVKDKASLLTRLKEKTIDGRFIIVEYERDTSNPWIPYPLNFSSLQNLAASIGFAGVVRLETAESQYHSGGIYSALIM